MTSTVEPKVKPISTADRRYRAVGTIYNDAIPIFLAERVLDEVIDYSEKDQSREIGGFLIGDLHKDKRQYVEIRHFLPAAYTESRAASLTFTHESWSAARTEIEKRFPEDRIVGWHHTHPRFGIFLSEYDKFIHRHYFSQPWEVAMVVDPCANELGFFQWRAGEITNCGFVCVIEE